MLSRKRETGSRRLGSAWGLATIFVAAMTFLAFPLLAQDSLAELAAQARQAKTDANCKVWTNDEVKAVSTDPASMDPAAIPGTLSPCEARFLSPEEYAGEPSASRATPAEMAGAAVAAARSSAESAGPVAESVPAPASLEPLPQPAPAVPPAAAPYNFPYSYYADPGAVLPPISAPPASNEDESPDLSRREAPQDGVQPSEIRPVESRWRTVPLEGYPDLTYRIYDPYNQNVLKADYPLAGNWFLNVTALQTAVYKARRNLDSSSIFADQIAAGTLKIFSYNNVVQENLIFGAQLQLNDDTFVPSPFRLTINGATDYKNGINALSNASDGNAALFNAYTDIQLADFGHDNFDLMFLRGGIQGFKSDFHGLIFNDVGLGGRIFGEKLKNRLRYDFAYFKLFQKNPVSGFIDFGRPSAHQVAIGRLAYDDFLAMGWNSEWTFHYNRDHRKPFGAVPGLDLDTFYFGATFNGHLGRWIFNPAVHGVAGHADHDEGGLPVQHSVLGWMALLDVQYPLDYWKFRFGYAFTSGDSDPTDHRDTGFDAISDGVTLFGGPLSYWVGENIKFGAGDFVRANSLYPSFRGVNGQANYANPGAHILNGGVDVVFSPKVSTSVNMNYLRFVSSGSYNNRIAIGDKDGAVEINVFVRWKPFLHQLNENIVFDTGFSVLQPLAGLRGAFQDGRTVFSTFMAFRFIF